MDKLKISYLTEKGEGLKMKKILKTLIFAIAAVLFISTPTSILASSHTVSNTISIDGVKQTVKTIKDDKNVRIAESVDELGKKSVATFDKINNTLLVENEGEAPVLVDLSKAKEAMATREAGETKADIMATVIKEYTFSNYEYEITMTNPKKWKIFRPKPNTLNSRYYKETTEASYNRTHLNNFKSAVDRLNDHELNAMALVGAGMFFTVLLTIFTGGIATAAAFASLGVTSTAIPVMIAWDRAENDALYSYLQV